MQGYSVARSRTLLLAGLSIAALAWTAPGQAQSAPKSPAADSGGSEDIIVTAQRRSERLVDVPASVVAISGEKLMESGITRFQDFGQSVAGVQIGVTGPLTQPSIRGITTTTAGTGAENNVGAYIDGFYQASQNQINQDLANLRSVEVLKGPQGALYGKNATGGAILINTLTPGNDLKGKLSISYGKLADRNLSAYVSIPVIKDFVAFSVTGNYHKNHGYIKDINCFADPVNRTVPGPGTGSTHHCRTAPFESRSLRVKAKVDYFENFSVTYGYNYYYTFDGRTLAYQLKDHPSATVKSVLAGTAAQPFKQAFLMRDRTSLNTQPVVKNQGDEYTALAELDLGAIGKVTSHTSYAVEHGGPGNFDIDASPVDSQTIMGTSLNKTFIQAIDYAYSGEKLTVLMGGMYFHQVQKSLLSRTTSANARTAANPLGILAQSKGYLNTPDSYSAYADVTYNLSDKLFLTAGGRYTSETKSADSFADTATARNVFVTQRQGGSATPQPRAKFHNFTPRAVLRYNVNDGFNVYASYSKGFKSGTFNTAANNIKPVKPETVNAFEVGAKMRGSSFHIEASGYYYDYKNLQISKVVLNPVTLAFQSGITSATSSRIYGADLSGDLNITRELNVAAGVAYLHARYRKFTGATGTDTIINPVPGATNNLTEITSSTFPQDWSGLQMVRAPAFSANFSATYTVDLAGGTLKLVGSGYATTKYAPKDDSLIRFVEPSGKPIAGQTLGKRRFVQPAYATFNALVNWTDPSDTYTIGAYLRNVANTRYRITFTSSAAGDYATFSEPRTYGIQVSAKF